MRTTCWLFAALWLAGMSSAHPQRRFRIGPTYSSLSLDDGSGSSHSFSSWGGSAALITGDDGETGVSIARYSDLSTDKGIRRLTLFTLDSYYYPVGTRGVVAPFALTALGLARVTEVDSLCVLSIIPCSATPSAPSPLGDQEGWRPRTRDRLRSPEDHGRVPAHRVRGECHSLRSGLRGLRSSGVGTAVRRGGLSVGRRLLPGLGPGHRAGSPRRIGGGLLWRAADVERQRAAPVVAAQLRRERLRGAGGRECE